MDFPIEFNFGLQTAIKIKKSRDFLKLFTCGDIPGVSWWCGDWNGCMFAFGFGPCGLIIPPGFMPCTFLGPLDIDWFGWPTIDDSDDSDESGDMDDSDDSGELFWACGMGEIGDIGILFRFIFCACIDCIWCCGDWFGGPKKLKKKTYFEQKS